MQRQAKSHESVDEGGNAKNSKGGDGGLGGPLILIKNPLARHSSNSQISEITSKNAQLVKIMAVMFFLVNVSLGFELMKCVGARPTGCVCWWTRMAVKNLGK